MLYPALHEIEKYFEGYTTVPVFHELLIDSCTPIHMFNALKDSSENCFILESVDNRNQWGRYSFIGINPTAEIVIENGEATFTKKGISAVTKIDNPIEYLTGILAEHRSPIFPNYPKLTGGLIGYFAYDTIRYMEKKLVHVPKDDLNMPDMNLFLYEEIVAFDHLTNKAVIIQNIRKGDIEGQYKACEVRAAFLAEKLKNYVTEPQAKKNYGEIKVTSNITKEQYIANVEKAKEYIVNGDIFQIVPSQRFEIENPPDALDVYRMLRSSNPSPYLYYFKHKDYQIAGASPEMLVNVTNGVVTTKPIAGTIHRGQTEKEDLELETQLLGDPKERAEHTMLVDLGRNDVGKVSKFGTVEVEDFMHVERYSKVMHIVSNVKGVLRDDKTALDALMSVLPAGTLSGAPKVRAMEIIDELETTKRGLYGGTVGYLAFDGNIDTCIAIRTVLFKNNKAYVQAGGGVVADSIPENEYQESKNKAQAMINAIEDASKL